MEQTELNNQYKSRLHREILKVCHKIGYYEILMILMIINVRSWVILIILFMLYAITFNNQDNSKSFQFF